MHRAFLMCPDDEITPEHLALPAAAGATRPAAGTLAVGAGMSIRDMERALIQETLQHVRGNRTEAAKLLGISIRTLRNKLHDIESGMQLAQNQGMTPQSGGGQSDREVNEPRAVNFGV